MTKPLLLKNLRLMGADAADVLIEGERMIGRIDMKADRKAGTLNVRKLWWEPKVRASAGRMDKLASELARIARFAGVGEVVLADDWLDA